MRLRVRPAKVADRGPWATAVTLATPEQGQAAASIAESAGESVPAAIRAFSALAASQDLTEPESLSAWRDRLTTLAQVNEVASRWHPTLWTADMDLLIRGTAGRRERKQNGWDVGWGARRSARKYASTLITGAKPADLHAALNEAAATLHVWKDEISRDPAASPHVIDISEAQSRLAEASEHVQVLEGTLCKQELTVMPLPDLSALVLRLNADWESISRVQRINNLRSGLTDHGLGPLLDWLTENGAEWATDQAGGRAIDAFTDVWAASLLKHLSMEDARVGGFDGTAHSRVEATFVRTDLSHRDTTPARIRRLAAERLARVRTDHPDQERWLDAELGRKRKVKLVRELGRTAPDVMLAAKPCWAMSPLVVAQTLPMTVKFDLVVFDEASQVKPADAICALARGRQAVVCGDSKQLPPTSFFDESTDWDDVDEQGADPYEAYDARVDADGSEATAESTGAAPPVSDVEALTSGAESLLDVFNSALGTNRASEYRLLWHYRSRDARLIAFSDAWFYDKSLLTFPGTSLASPLEFHQVPARSGQIPNVADEVEYVVDLCLDHAQSRPDESLGVIALGLTHARRIETALNLRLRDADDDIRTFFSESGDEPFFVKNLERVQGDERDAILISLGYAKDASGKLAHRFGPINIKGRERRLNVAVSRAKERLTLVASFNADDMDPSRTSGDGPRALRAYLQYAASGGSDLGDRGPEVRPLNPFEIHMRDRLLAAGIPVIPQFGVAGYWIDFACQHPDRPGQMVLAIEADGASYHSSETARARDRLRQEHLERLGWIFLRIWSTDYFRNPDAEIANAKSAYEKAVISADAPSRRVEPARVVPRPETAVIPKRVGRKPCSPGMSIGDYSPDDLLRTVKWVASDGLVRTDDELLADTMVALGFQRRGRGIVARIGEAVRQFRHPSR